MEDVYFAIAGFFVAFVLFLVCAWLISMSIKTKQEQKRELQKLKAGLKEAEREAEREAKEKTAAEAAAAVDRQWETVKEKAVESSFLRDWSGLRRAMPFIMGLLSFLLYGWLIRVLVFLLIPFFRGAYGMWLALGLAAAVIAVPVVAGLVIAALISRKRNK